MSAMSGSPNTLGLTDRSRFSAGWGRCARLRYVEYHSGPDGYGQKRKSGSIPLVTGGRTHEAITDSIIHNDPEKHIRAAVARYRKEATAGGLLDLVAPVDRAQLQWTIDEQACLIEGLAWGFWDHVLPWIQREFEILETEREEELVVGCSCGLGDAGLPENHLMRDCIGTVLTSRPDMILRAKSDKSLCILDLKTAGGIGFAWKRQWDDEVKQLALGAHLVELRMGEPVHHAYIVGLNKGPRPHSYNEATGQKDGPKRQDSRFCYAYYRPAGPPFEGEDWKTGYNYVDEDGKGRKATTAKGYGKIPIWEAELGPGAPVSSIEHYVRNVLTPEDVKPQYEVVGPLRVARQLVKHLKIALATEEMNWRQKLWMLYAAAEANGIGTDPWIEILDEQCPQTWECYRFSGYCPYYDICKENEGWRQFFTGEHDGFTPRRPHHDRELAEMKARGIPVPVDPGEEEGE